jgi:HK97 family phage major capsid protein
MAMTAKELRQKLGEMVHQSRAILERAEKDGRARTGEEEAELKKYDAEMDQLEGDIERADKQERREVALAQPVGQRGLRLEAGRPTDEENQEALEKRFRDRFGALGQHLARRTPGNHLATKAYRHAFDRWLTAPKGSADSTLSPEEKRALSMGVAAQGGYTIPQEEFIAELIKTMDNQAIIRGLARTFQVPQAQSLGAPTLAADPADPDWTSELSAGTEDSTMAVGRREMHPWPIAKYIKVSDKLLRASPLGMEGIVRDRLAYKVAVAHSTAFNTGDGVNKPLGLFTADANGISTARNVDVSTTNVIDPDKLITARYTLRAGYYANARWLLHRTYLAKIRQLKLGSGLMYVWQPGLAVGAPNTLLDFPYSVDEYAPAFAAGTGVNIAILGNFDYYWIVDALDVRLQRLDELFALTNQVAFVIRAETDAQPVLEDAFVRCIGTLT